MNNKYNPLQTLTAALLLALPFVFFWSLPVARAADNNPPGLMTYQGFLVDGNGMPLATNAPKNYDVVFRIYDGQSGGGLKWSEQQTVTADKGFFSVLMGEGSQVGSEARGSLSSVFSALDASDRFVAITVKGIGPNNGNVDILPRLRMVTSPYSYLAANAVNAANLVNSSNKPVMTVVSGNVGINKLSPNSALDVNGTVTATNFTGDGSGLTGLNAGNISSGTLADARLSANVALLNKSSQTFSGGTNTFSGRVGIGTTSPITPLTVQSVSSAYGMIHTDGTVQVGTYVGGSTGGGWFGTKSNHKLSLFVNNGSPSLTVDVNGGVGIGTTTVSEGVLSLGGVTFLNNNDIYLREGKDHTSGLGYYGGGKGFAGMTTISSTTTLDGPVLYGYDGGLLGTTKGSQQYALAWDSTGKVYARTGFINGSDRNLKENFSPVNSKAMLAKVVALPISEWNYKSENAATRHVGPMAQDFYGAFKVGSDDKHISTIDEGGVALAAIKGLNELVQEKDAEIQTLKSDLQQLRLLVESLAKQKTESR